MLGPADIVLAPWRAARVLIRAADDLNSVAERARRDPDPVEEAQVRLDALFRELETLIGAVRTVDASAVALGAGGEDLLGPRESSTPRRGRSRRGAVTCATPARCSTRTRRSSSRAGRKLTAVAKDMAHSLRIFRAALPRLLEGLETVEELEASVDTVAETVEPLQDVAKGVGRVTDRLTRRS